MRRDNWILFGAVTGSLAIIVVIGLGLTFLPRLLLPQPTPVADGFQLDKPRLMSDFTLTNQDGQPTKLSDLRGKAVLLFFGYTHCADVCPLTLTDFKKVKQALQQSSPALANRVVYVMISVDGKRDTPAVMKQYMDMFDPTFTGLTGDLGAVNHIAIDGAQAEIEEPNNSQANYTVAHTSFTYLLDPQGYWRAAYPYQTPTNQIASDIVRFLQ